MRNLGSSNQEEPSENDAQHAGRTRRAQPPLQDSDR